MATSTRLPPLAPNASLRWDVVRRQVAVIHPRTVLEVGCGQGAVGARLARVAEYVGVEPDLASYRAARDRLATVGGEVRHGTSSAVPPGARYDLVCAFEVLEHIEDDKGALSEWVRLVRPGGHLMVSVPAWQQRFSEWDELVGHVRRYSPEELTDRLGDAGLIETTVTLYGWPLGHLLEAGRNRIAARRMSAVSEASFEVRTASSGRLLQPTALAGLAVRAGIAPFGLLQRLRPDSGTGIVAVGRRPV